MSRWRKAASSWLLRRLPRQQQLVLGQSRIYLLPTTFGWGLLLVAWAVWIGALNYAVSLAYVLSFWVVSLVLIAVVLAYRQLAGLAIRCGAVDDVVAGSHALFPLQLQWPEGESRLLRLGWHDEAGGVVLDYPGEVLLPRLTLQRGQMTIPPLRVYSESPLGLVRAFAYLRLQTQVCVYPQPCADERTAASLPDGGQLREQQPVPGELFSHLVTWQPELGARRIAWKAYARRGVLLARRFEEPQAARATCLLEWSAYPAEMAAEARLSRLCWQLLAAARRGEDVVLRLPQQELRLTAGEVRPGLRALAGFGVRDAQ